MSRLRGKFNALLSSEINKKIFTYSFWILAGNIVSKLVLLLATVWMTKYLGKDEYGQFGIIKSTVIMFTVFAGLELGLTATKFISQLHHTDPEKVGRIVGLSNLFSVIISMLIAALVYLFAKKIAANISAPMLFREIRLSAVILLFASLNGVQNGILAGLSKFRELSLNSTIAGVLSSLAMIFAARYYNLYYVVAAFGANYIILFVLNVMLLRRSFYNSFRVRLLDRANFKEIRVLWHFTLPAVLAGLMVAPVSWLCNYFLVNCPGGFSQMAVFDIANQWRNTIMFIPAALAQVALPMLSSSVTDQAEYRDIYRKNLKINIGLAVVLVLVFVAASPVIVKFYSSGYHDALLPLIIMFVTTGFITVNNVIGQVIASRDKMWIGFYVNLFWAVVLLSSCWLLVSVYQLGAVGISLAYLISYVCHTFTQFLVIKNIMK